MEATELRIGNVITVDNKKHRPLETGAPHIVKEIRKESEVVTLMGVELIEYGQLFEYLKPIPLTEDWLKAFGFEKKDEGHYDYWYNNELMFTDVLPENLELVEYEHAPCRYVHQLQNLYYALTGKELVKQ